MEKPALAKNVLDLFLDFLDDPWGTFVRAVNPPVDPGPVPVPPPKPVAPKLVRPPEFIFVDHGKPYFSGYVTAWKGEIVTDENRERIEDDMIEHYGLDPDAECGAQRGNDVCTNRPGVGEGHYYSMCRFHSQEYVDRGWR